MYRSAVGLEVDVVHGQRRVCHDPALIRATPRWSWGFLHGGGATNESEPQTRSTVAPRPHRSTRWASMPAPRVGVQLAPYRQRGRWLLFHELHVDPEHARQPRQRDSTYRDLDEGGQRDGVKDVERSPSSGGDSLVMASPRPPGRRRAVGEPRRLEEHLYAEEGFSLSFPPERLDVDDVGIETLAGPAGKESP